MLRCGRLGIVKPRAEKKKFGKINGRVIQSRRTAYVVYERARKITGWLDSRDRQEVHYEGKVYCATVSSHILFVRRNGKPLWCGNTVMQYAETDKLAEEMLMPLEPVLRTLGHRGDFAVNAMIDTTGKAWFLEFTARCGYPAWWIQTASHRGDPVKWMIDLLAGRDSLKVSYDVAIGVVMAQPQYPYDTSSPAMVEGIPIQGADDVMPDIHLVEAMMGTGPVMDGGKVVDQPVYETAGEYVLVATGLGKTVERARKRVYQTVDAIKYPNRMYRTDIGIKVIDKLDKLHRFGYVTDMHA
jgi:phosphoribosylamine--glycine ligase